MQDYGAGLEPEGSGVRLEAGVWCRDFSIISVLNARGCDVPTSDWSCVEHSVADVGRTSGQACVGRDECDAGINLARRTVYTPAD
jgi:hypothetical protein